MTLLEIVKSLCDEHGETFASLERKLNFGNGTIRKWDGATPSGDKLARVADYFNVSIDYLLGREEKASEYPELKEIYLSLAKDAQAEKLDPDDLRLIMDTVKKLRNKPQGD